MLLVLFAVLFISSILELSGLALVIPYVNLMMSSDALLQYQEKFPALSPLLTFEEDYRLTISILFGAFFVVKNSALAVFAYTQRSILKNIQVAITDRMFCRRLREPYSYHAQANSSVIVRELTYDTINFIDGVLLQSTYLLLELLLLAGVVVVMLIVNPAALLVLGFVVVPVLLIYKLIKNRLGLWGKILQQREDRVIRNTQESLGGIKDAIVLNVLPYFENKFHSNVKTRAHIKRNRDVVMIVPRYVIETVIMVSMAGVLMYLAQSGGIVENLSIIAFMAVVTVRLLPMSNRTLSAISVIRSSLPSVNVLYDIARPDIEGTDDRQNSSVRLERPPFVTLNLDSVSFSYGMDSAILTDLSFSIDRGEKIGIVGGSGSGKTTLIDLMLGLLHPSHGKIEVDGMDIHQDILSWQQTVGYVQQSVFLLDATIEENIAFGIPIEKIDNSRIHKVMRLARIEEWVDGLSNRSKTIVGERGARISGGQKQRIGIARALYNNPDILILDEATSALDNHTESEIMEDVYNMNKGRTVVMVAHRLDTIRRCDRILVLDQGHIVGSGSFEDLLSHNVTFKNLASSSGNNNV